MKEKNGATIARPSILFGIVDQSLQILHSELPFLSKLNLPVQSKLWLQSQ